MSVLRFEPLEGQRAFLEATEEEVLYSGAFGAGKTEVLARKAHFLSYFFPGNEGLIARRYAADLPETTLKKLLEVIPEEAIIDHNQTKKKLTIESKVPGRPSFIYYRGLDRPWGVASMTLGWALVDEAIEIEQEQWIMLEGRLRLNTVPFRQLGAATNPGSPGHWLHERFFVERPLNDEGKPVRRLIQADAFQNRHNPEDYRARLRRFKGVFYERYVLGKWVGFTGLVYQEWNPAKHVIASFEIPEDWPRYRAIDWGTANPFCCLWAAMRPSDGALFIYRQIYMSGRTALEHAHDVKRHSQGESYQWTVADHDLGDRLIFLREGIQTLPAFKKKDVGIQLVQERISLTDEEGAQREPRLFVFEDSLVEVDQRLEQEGEPYALEHEPGYYKWQRKKGAAQGTQLKDEPLDERNHGLDALRYLVAEIGRRGGQATRPSYKKGAQARAVDAEAKEGMRAALRIPRPKKKGGILF